MRPLVHWTNADVSRALSMAREGVSVRQISAELERSPYVVMRLLRRKGVRINRTLSAIYREAQKKREKGQ